MTHMRAQATVALAIFLASAAPVPAFCAGLLPALQAPDNSSQNKQQAQPATADGQSNAQTDRMLTAKVRRAIMADKDLSMYAHNVKIIAKDGAVTLKGPVKSDDEKQKIASDISSIVPSDKLTNQLTVKQ